MKVKKICAVCGSTELVKLVECTWDENKQEWVPTTMFDETKCLKCGAESQCSDIVKLE